MHPWVTAEMGEVPIYLPPRPQFVEPDDRFLQQLPSYGCDIEKVKLDLRGGVFNPETSVYHLLVEKARVELERQQEQERHRAMLASRTALSSRGRRSQHQIIPPPFDQTMVPLVSPRGLSGSDSDAPLTAAAAAAAAFAHMQHVKNSRKTLSGSSENEMQAARARFVNGALNQQQMQALSSRLTPVALTQSQPQLSSQFPVSIPPQPDSGPSEIVLGFLFFFFVCPPQPFAFLLAVTFTKFVQFTRR